MGLTPQEARDVECVAWMAHGVVRRHYDHIAAWVLEHDDLAQAGLVAMCRARQSWEPRKGPWPMHAWVAARRGMADELRCRMGRNGSRLPLPVLVDVAPEGAGQHDPALEADPFAARTIDQALEEHLTPQERRVLRLVAHNDGRQRSAADALGVTESRVSQVMSRARRRLATEPALRALAA
jgi:RNA polymerase sigma factor (sigma-70 family)